MAEPSTWGTHLEADSLATVYGVRVPHVLNASKSCGCQPEIQCFTTVQ